MAPARAVAAPLLYQFAPQSLRKPPAKSCGGDGPAAIPKRSGTPPVYKK
jgi:hypothetical protein